MAEFYNAPFMAGFSAWLIAQILKNAIYIIKHRKITFERLMGAGGMPSSHSAAVCGLAAMIVRTDGITSTVFAVAAGFALIVMYDASGVRRAAGMHAKEINQIKNIIDEIEEDNRPGKDGMAGITNIGEINKENIEEKKEHLKEFIGHSPFEVFLGAIIGVIVGAIFPISI
jgi:hypothetical protein